MWDSCSNLLGDTMIAYNEQHRQALSYVLARLSNYIDPMPKDGALMSKDEWSKWATHNNFDVGGLLISLHSNIMSEYKGVHRSKLSYDRSGGIFGFGETITYWVNDDGDYKQVPKQVYNKILMDYDIAHMKAFDIAHKELEAIMPDIKEAVGMKTLKPGGGDNAGSLNFTIQQDRRKIVAYKVMEDKLLRSFKPQIESLYDNINRNNQRLKAMK